jgi:hypothetical protein
MPDEIKRIIVNHCSPVLLGCKPSALFTLGSEGTFTFLSGFLGPRLNLKVLQKSSRGLLVLAFERERLEAALLKSLLNPEALVFLARMGYPREASLFVLLDYLRKRLRGGEFPHEIGFFLGYPPEDVLDFVRYRGQKYKLCGYWKVYGDVEEAKKCFHRYDVCRECFRALLSKTVL